MPTLKPLHKGFWKIFWRAVWVEKSSSERGLTVAGIAAMLLAIGFLMLIGVALIRGLFHPVRHTLDLIIAGLMLFPSLLAGLVRRLNGAAWVKKLRALGNYKPVDVSLFTPILIPLVLLAMPWIWLTYELMGGRKDRSLEDWVTTHIPQIVLSACLPLIVASYYLVAHGFTKSGLSLATGIAFNALASAYAGISIRDGAIGYFGKMKASASPQSTLALVAIFASAFGCVHLAVWKLSPAQYTGLHDWQDALYFSVVTMATVGYGDVAPLGSLARLLTCFEIGAGVLMLVVVVNTGISAWAQSTSYPSETPGKDRLTSSPTNIP